MTARTFSLGAVLSVTTGVLLAEIGDVRELLDFITGDTLMTHQLPRASDEAAPEILRQHPDLAGMAVPDGLNTFPLVAEWLKTQNLGETRELTPMSPEDHTFIHPFAELKMRAPHIEVIPVVVSDVD